MTEFDCYAQHSVFSDPGEFAAAWDTVNPDLSSMKRAVQPLLFHYREGGDFAESGITKERISEIDLRYTDAMLKRIHELEPVEPGAMRAPSHRMVGCCRDWALLFVSLARHHGFAVRSRVGFANYFAKDWWIDHTIAEIWDEAGQRWRLIDPELADGFAPAAGKPFDPLDIPRHQFLPGLDAWQRVRAGELDETSFVVAPQIDLPALRGFPYLWHNVVQDLAALNRHEMILWDVWGIDLDPVNADGAALLDEVAAASTLAEWQHHFSREEFRVPTSVLSFSPYRGTEPRRVPIRQQS